MKNEIKAFKILTDETRIRILRLLLLADIELCVCEIVESLDLPSYTISRHIKELKNSYLVSERKEGRFIFHSIPEDLDPFSKKLLELIQMIPGEYFKNDKLILKDQLKNRREGCK